MFAVAKSVKAMSGSPRRGVTRVSVILVSALAWLLLLTGASAYAGAPLRWSAPVLVDPAVPPVEDSFGIVSVSCPSVSLCVAFDDLGHVITTTTPSVPESWRMAGVRGAGWSTYVSCPSPAGCVALDELGDVLDSTNPSDGARSWHSSPSPASFVPTALACPSPQLCVGVGLRGDVFSSTDPTRGASSWREVHVDSAQDSFGTADFVGLSCPSVDLCVAVDDVGNVLSSVSPTGGASAWKRVHLVDRPVDSSIVCPSASWCVALEGTTVFSSSDPTGDPTAWHASDAPLALLGAAGLSCPSVSLCVAGEVFGGVVTSSDPTAGEQAWTPVQVDGSNAVNAVSCPSVSFCAAVDYAGNVIVGAPTVNDIPVPRVEIRGPADQEQLIARRHGRQRVVDSGLTIACPPHGPACVVTGKARANFDPSANNLLARIHQTIPAGQRRKIVFTLTAHGVRLLNRSRGVISLGVLTIVARAGHGAAVGNTLLYTLAIPSKALPTFGARSAAGVTAPRRVLRFGAMARLSGRVL